MSISRGMVCALLFLLGVASDVAQACSTSNWGGIGGGGPTAFEPADQPGATRYSGRCALGGDAGTVGFVTDNTPFSESVFRARFYVFTGTDNSNPRVFLATSADNAAGVAVVAVDYDGVGQRFRFSFDGGSVDAPPGSAPAFRWVAVELLYQAGQPFRAWTTHRGVETPVVSAGSAAAASVGSASLGVVAAGGGGPGAVYFDTYESTRSSSTRIGPLCRGDTNFDFSIGLADAGQITDERVRKILANGPPDCNEDGLVDVFDVACVHRRRIDVQQCSALGKSTMKLALIVFSDEFE